MNFSNFLTNENSLSYNERRYPTQGTSNLENGIVCRKKGNTMQFSYSTSQSSLQEFIHYWLETKKRLEVKPATYERLLISAHTLSGFPISNLPIEEITSDDFRDYIQELLDAGYSKSTIKKQMEIVSAPLRFAYEQRLISFNPCSGAKTPSKARIKYASREVQAFDKEEQSRLLEVLTADNRDTYCAMLIMLETGLRVGEVLALQWDDIDIDRKRIHVHSTLTRPSSSSKAYIQEGAKTESSNRIVPLSPNALQIFNTLKLRNFPGDVLRCKTGDRLSYKTLLKNCKFVCEKAGVPYKGLHVWRHTFATNLYYKGVDVKILSKLLGHSSTTVTYNVYVNLYGDGFEDMLNAVS
ncbi:MAG: tyrosine-type recombinase/integrase [Clostridia bacterium]|nr:tyrosine-type recombinase/integrase [Clostridia bacterium]